MKVESVYFMLDAVNMDRAVAFYRDVLGLTVNMTSEHWSELRIGDATVAFHGGGDGQRRRTGLGFDVADVEAACVAIEAGGGTIVAKPARSKDAPIILARFADPEGNEVTITQNVPYGS